MRYAATAVRWISVGILGCILLEGRGPAAAGEPVLIAKPDAYKTLVNPACSQCVTEAKRRVGELKPNDPVLAWTRTGNAGGAIPYRFFLEPYRVISDSYGVFVYDPDAGFARGFPRSRDFSFYGWRNGIMVMKHKDGTLYSTLSGRAFAGPRKGEQLRAIPTITTRWGDWTAAYPKSVTFTMFEKYQPIELAQDDNTDSVRSRGPADKRLPANTQVIGVAHEGKIRAYRVADLMKAGGLIRDTLGGKPIVVLWYAPTRTAAVYSPDIDGSKAKGENSLQQVTLALQKDGSFIDGETKSRWGIDGRAQAGPLLRELTGISDGTAPITRNGTDSGEGRPPRLASSAFAVGSAGCRAGACRQVSESQTP